VDRLKELLHPFAPAGHGRYHRHSELRLEPLDIDRDSVPTGLVHQVEADDHSIGDRERLQEQVQVPLEPSRVDHDHGDVRAAEEEEVSRDLFIDRTRLEGVRPRQVDDLDPLALVREGALRAHDRLPGPVAGVLAQAGECVEDRALPRVRVPGEGHEDIPPIRR